MYRILDRNVGFCSVYKPQLIKFMFELVKISTKEKKILGRSTQTFINKL